MRRAAKAPASGVALRDLLILIGVLGVLGAMAAPVLAFVRAGARDAGCKANLRRLWSATTAYARAHEGALFVNLTVPPRISNVIYRRGRIASWGHLHPRYLADYHTFFCPGDDGRGPAWTYGWSNWQADRGEVQCSYGYRGRQGLVADATVGLSMAMLERRPEWLLGCDFYEPFFAPPRVHHRGHTNLLRCNGSVGRVDQEVSFGPTVRHIDAAVRSLDRAGRH
ncbi:MAG: type II secretion system protein [Candidatus Brocadiia bacterium]